MTERIADKTFPQAFSPKGDFAIALALRPRQVATAACLVYNAVPSRPGLPRGVYCIAE